jgi:hypothetical protein
MELEGCNWTDDFPEEFIKRRGYDIMPYLPFIMYKVGRLGSVIDFNYGVSKSGDFNEELGRVRFDFEYTKAELLYERFTLSYLEWCREKGVMARAQAYGRGFFPLQTSLGYDIPEGESWTTNWLKHRVGEEMPDDDYRRGRAYTMINKYVSSAAHLSGKRVISCEEMTNTYLVFNTSLERLKNGSDQSIISGITHSVWHGFNYSPPEAPYPGWIQYGSYLNEQNNWWPYFKLLNIYKARISALLQNADMYSDIAILPANYDLWTTLGVQTDPFPERLNIEYTSLLWEVICKNGGSADYLNENIIQNCKIENGMLSYGSKKYSTLFLPGVESITPESLATLYKFALSGGKILCIDSYPHKSPGLNSYRERDIVVKGIIEKLKGLKNSFILLKRPEDGSFLDWYSTLQKDYNLPHYLELSKPDPFLMQLRYRTANKEEILFFSNSSTENDYRGEISFTDKLSRGRKAWIWDPESGKRYLCGLKGRSFMLELGPAQSLIIVFDRSHPEAADKNQPAPAKLLSELKGPWTLEFKHCRGDKYNSLEINSLQDLSELDKYKYFSGTIIYTTTLNIKGEMPEYIELKRTYDIAELETNGHYCGTRWYGKRIFNVGEYLRPGKNEIRIKIVTLMGNYIKSLDDNPVAQYWTNKDRKNQPLSSLGLAGPVLLYN